ncbi:hypothetical protein ACFV42_23775 [Streptomyces solisilvae]|uniref:hypothetical protein n=1 Tax=Streptomyces malaysiensis TaxID=92644 RepID=UPI0036C2C335
MSPTSLTAELANPNSPVSRFLGQHLPGANLHAAYSKAVRRLPTLKYHGALDRVPWPLLGTAIDYRIRMWLGEKNHVPIAEGISILGAPEVHSTPGSGLTDICQSRLNAAAAGDLLLDRMAAHAGPLMAEEEGDAARLAIVSARYDAVYRTAAIAAGTRAISYFTVLRLPPDPVKALELLTGQIPRPHTDDICRQAAAAALALADIKGQPLTCAPTFAGSPHVGHAEGDFIAGEVLVDIKSTLTPQLRPDQARTWFHQLAGYLLLDYDNTHSIKALGIYLSRQAVLLTWPVEDFLRLMGARIPLDVLRRRLKHTLTPHTIA